MKRNYSQILKSKAEKDIEMQNYPAPKNIKFIMSGS